jgi:hypothetical protein
MLLNPGPPWLSQEEETPRTILAGSENAQRSAKGNSLTKINDAGSIPLRAGL